MGLPGAAPERGRLPHIAKYDVTEEIGHGGMATVYRAHDPRLSRDVAIKVIHRHLRDSEEIAHRFFAEAKAVAKLRHPNIVEVYDVSSPDEDEQYLVVELLRGATLRKILQQHGALPPEVGAAIGIELLAALSHAHGSGVIHRDIKPENVMLEHLRKEEAADAEGQRVKIKLTDFGIAKLLDAQGVTSTGQVLGSPAHMAPEQIEGGDVDGRADVFGAGVLLYECLVGHLPFEGSNPAQVLRRVLEGAYPRAEREQPTVGKMWSGILDRALSHAPDDRFADPSEMREALTEELRRLGIVHPRQRIEEWMDDPDAYKARHQDALIAKLCELGSAARRLGDAMAAAADYNRALAYAPHDMALMRIVSTMHRAEARRRVVRRLAPVLLTAITAGFVAFFATRAIRAVTAEGAHVDAGTKPEPTLVLTTEPSATPSVTPSAKAIPTTPKPIPALPVHASASASKEPIERQLVFHRPNPEFGMRAKLDGEATIEVLDGTHMTMDGHEHTLVLSCANDFCEPKKIPIAPGDKVDDITPRLSIKPALLLIEGDPTASYTIEELPMVTVRSGVQVQVPLSTGSLPIHVVQRPSGRKETVKLTAGQEVKATFVAGP